MGISAHKRSQDHHVQSALEHLALGLVPFGHCLSTRTSMERDHTPLELLWEPIAIFCGFARGNSGSGKPVHCLLGEGPAETVRRPAQFRIPTCTASNCLQPGSVSRFDWMQVFQVTLDLMPVLSAFAPRTIRPVSPSCAHKVLRIIDHTAWTVEFPDRFSSLSLFPFCDKCGLCDNHHDQNFENRPILPRNDP